MEKYIKTPLNYTGGKFKLLPQIMPLFPEKFDTFVDVFGGGFNVGINVKCKHILYNDICFQVAEMLEYFKSTSIEYMLNQINSWIYEYNLSKENQEGYLEFRKFYNTEKTPLKLYTLICYAFNNQIRFNSKGDYNISFGNGDFNSTLQKNFIKFVDKLHMIKVDIYSVDFRKIDISKINKYSFFYCDPPYFNSNATYNENGGWKQEDENALLDILNQINSKGLKFALSNNLTTNPNLEEWASNNGYIIHYLNANYSNCSYHKKDRTTKDNEVLIVNY